MAKDTLRLYVDPMAPNVRRVRMFAADKGIPLEEVVVDIPGAEHKGKTFQARNPFGQVPVLELPDGTCLSESVAICRFLDDRFLERPLFGRTAMERAVIEMWQRRAEFGVFLPAVECGHHSHPYFAKQMEQIPAWAATNQRRFESTLPILDRELGVRDFLAGPAFSVADVTAFCGFELGRMFGLEVPTAFANVVRWRERVGERRSAAAARYL